MENRAIPDSNITASSSFNKSFGPERARLHMKMERKGDVWYSAGWGTKMNDTKQWLEINMKEVINVTGIVTQGGYYQSSPEYGWVTSYSLSYRVEDQGQLYSYQNDKVRIWKIRKSHQGGDSKCGEAGALGQQDCIFFTCAFFCWFRFSLEMQMRTQSSQTIWSHQ